jgi:excisionase family DNA binding protein
MHGKMRFLMLNNSKPQPRLLNVSAAASYLSCSEWTVRRLIWRGDLASVRVGRSVRLDRADLDAFVDRQKTKNGDGFRDCDGARPRRRALWLPAFVRAWKNADIVVPRKVAAFS